MSCCVNMSIAVVMLPIYELLHKFFVIYVTQRHHELSPLRRKLGPLHTVPQTAFPRPRQEDCVPLLNRDTIQARLAAISQAYCEVLWEAGLDDFFLCFTNFIGDAIKLKALFSIVNHKGSTRVSISWLTDTARINDGSISLCCFPMSFRRNKHFIRYLDHTFAQPQQR